MKLSYVANQLMPEGLDEVQRLVIAYKLGQHVALSGPPGAGKTDLVLQLPKIVEKPLFEITCDELMTEAPLVGFPVLAGQNGSSVTEWENGMATQAADKNGIFYGDEFDQLQGTVQKRLNPLFDHRRRITRRDGAVITAKDDFFGVISYNPSDRLAKQELEEAVADRFVHMSFNYLPPQLEAGLAIDDVSQLGLEERAVLFSGDKDVRFLRKEGAQWKDFFSETKVTHADKAVAYDVFLRPRETQILPPQMSEADLADKIAHYFISIRSFADQGTTKLEEPIKEYLREIGEVTSVRLHRPSTRIIKAALAQYGFLIELGMQQEKAQAYAARLCIDQISYGKFGLRPLGKGTVKDAVSTMAAFYDLIGKPRQRTDL